MDVARPGYPTTTDGMWPYTYNPCDVGIFPIPTNPDKLGPPVALVAFRHAEVPVQPQAK